MKKITLISFILFVFAVSVNTAFGVTALDMAQTHIQQNVNKAPANTVKPQQSQATQPGRDDDEHEKSDRDNNKHKKEQKKEHD